MTEKSKEHLEVVNKLKSLEERKEMLEEQLGVLKYRTTDLSNAVLLERSELVDELTGLTNTIGEVIYGGENNQNMMSNLRRIMQKVNEEEPSDDKPSLDKTNARNSASLMRNKSAHVGHIREGREGAYLYRSRCRCGLAVVCVGVSAVRGLRMRPCRRCHTAGTASRRCAQAQPLSAALLGAGRESGTPTPQRRTGAA